MTMSLCFGVSAIGLATVTRTVRKCENRLQKKKKERIWRILVPETKIIIINNKLKINGYREGRPLSSTGEIYTDT